MDEKPESAHRSAPKPVVRPCGHTDGVYTCSCLSVHAYHRKPQARCVYCQGSQPLRDAPCAPDPLRTRPDYNFRCQRCGAPHNIDTSIPSAAWNAIAEGKYGALCTLCIDELLTEHSLMCEAEFYYVGTALRSKPYPRAAAPDNAEDRLRTATEALWHEMPWPVYDQDDAREVARNARDVAEYKAKIHAALEAVVAEEREACAKVAHRSNFVDGPEGTIEGQIARAIRARGLEEKP